MPEISWLYLALLASSVWALRNILDKVVISKCFFTLFLFLVAVGIVGGTIGGILLTLQGGQAFLLPRAVVCGSIVAGIIYYVGISLYFKALLAEEVSRVIPMFFLTPVIVLVIATTFLGEILELREYLGISMLVCGAILISFRKGLRPKISKALWIMLMAGFFFAISEVYTKYLLQFTNYWNIFALTRMGTLFGAVFLLLIFRATLIEEWKRVKKKSSVYLVGLSESLNLLGIFFFTVALSLGKVSLVSALHGTQPFFTLFFAILLSIFAPRILKEEYGVRTLLVKIVSIFLITCGTFLLA
jgi:transporter family protein